MHAMASQADEAIREAAERRVHAEFPEEEAHLPEHERQGVVPEVFREREATDSMDIRPPAMSSGVPKKRFLITEKNATPQGPASESVGEAIEESDPRCCIMDRSAGVASHEKGMRSEAFRSFLLPEEKEMVLRTGHDMIDQ